MVSQQYIKGCRGFDILDLVACSDIDLERAKTVARQWNIPKACSVEELLADPEIQIVINLTIPQAHVPVSESVVEAGKHVYSEKPLAVTLEDGKRLLAAAGPVCTMIASHGVYEESGLPKIEVDGTKGLLSVADPNIHGGVVGLRRPGYDWEEIPVRHSNKRGRGVGVADMADAITYSQ